MRFGALHDALDAGVAVDAGGEKRSQGVEVLGHGRREGDDRVAGETHVVGADRRQALQPPARLGDGVIDQRGDEPPRRLVERAGSFEAGIGCAHLGKRAAGKRHLGKLGEGEKAGAIAVIDVMIVVGDVVGERGKLRFDRGKGVEREILPHAIIDDRGRDGTVPLAQRAADRCA